jgi:hypothetical protein
MRIISQWILTAIFCLLRAFSAHGQVATVGNDWVTYRPVGAGFRVVVPPNWTPETSRDPNVRLLVRAPASGTAFADCEIVVRLDPRISQADVQEFGSTSATDDFWINSINRIFGISIEIPIISVHERRLTRISNMPAHFRIFSHIYGNPNAHVRTISTTASIMLMTVGKMYMINCSVGSISQRNSENAWIYWRPIIMAILGTWVIEDDRSR